MGRGCGAAETGAAGRGIICGGVAVRGCTGVDTIGAGVGGRGENGVGVAGAVTAGRSTAGGGGGAGGLIGRKGKIIATFLGLVESPAAVIKPRRAPPRKVRRTPNSASRRYPIP